MNKVHPISKDFNTIETDMGMNGNPPSQMEQMETFDPFEKRTPPKWVEETQ